MRQATFEDLGPSLFDTTFVVLDLETTGGSAESDAITEVGALKTYRGEVVGTFHCLVRPDHPIAPYVELLTGITNEMVAPEAPIEQVLPNLAEFLRGSVLVAHNSAFDSTHLRAAFKRHGYHIPFAKSVCTYRMARWLMRGETRDLKLTSLAQMFHTRAIPCHRAFSDAEATLEIFHRLLELAAPLGVVTLDDLLAFCREGKRPYLDKARFLKGIPVAPGVYTFLNRSGKVLYVGKAKNLRARVRSYFYGDSRPRIADMMSEVAAVDVTRCSCELEAEVAELRLISKEKPRFNRRGKFLGKSPHWLKLATGPLPRVIVARALKDEETPLLGPFADQATAKSVLDAIRDAVPIARCSDPRKHPDGCAFGQMNRCIAPCFVPNRALHTRLLLDLGEDLETGGLRLLETLQEKMDGYAASMRYEAAAVIKNRIELLQRFIGRSQASQRLRSAGDLVVCSEAGDQIEYVCVRDGLLVETGMVSRVADIDVHRILGFAPPASTRRWRTLQEMEEVMTVNRYLARAETAGARVFYCSGSLDLTLLKIAS